MKITQISYERIVNLGNYENFKLGATGLIAENENVNTAMKELKTFVSKECEVQHFLLSGKKKTCLEMTANPDNYSFTQVETAKKLLALYEVQDV